MNLRFYAKRRKNVNRRLSLTVLVLLAASFFIVESARAQDFWGSPSLTPAMNTSGFQASVGLRKYINSFTSYEFPDPDRPQLDPLSRLEWPWEQTAGVVNLGYAMRGLGVRLDFASTLFLPSFLKAQDSDWEDPDDPGQKTTFSEAKAKPRLWTFDGNVVLDMPSTTVLKAVAGYRAQQFSFTYTDILQGTIWDDNTQSYRPVAEFSFDSGPAIEFSQYYKHWYGGGILATSFDLGLLTDKLSNWLLFLTLQADYGYVKANNLDFHILRIPGPRFTAETTTGSSWHINLATKIHCSERLAFRLEGDFIRISTRGSHNWREPGQNESWDGARVWSDQKYIAASGTLAF